MIRTLIQLIKAGNVTQQEMFPDLPQYSRGLPMVTQSACAADSGCTQCVDTCPTSAISIANGLPSLDRGLCIACGGCMDACPTGTIAADRRTEVAVRKRGDLVLSPNQVTTTPGRSEDSRGALPSPFQGEGLGVRWGPRVAAATHKRHGIFRHSLHVREVSTGDNASDMETAATNNPIFDASRFGVHVVASPRFADALVVTGPVGRAMREPLLRCWDAMAEPRVVVAVGASAISGGLHRGGYAEADGVDSILPVAVYVPGHPPHPWYILHGLTVAMGR